MEPRKIKERLINPDEMREIKAATRASLRKIVASKFALVTRYDEAELSNFGSVDDRAANKFMPADVIAEMQKELPRGIPSALLEELAKIAGCRLVPLDEDGSDGVAFDDVGRAIKESGEAGSAALKAVGTTCLHTVRSARQEATEARDEFGGLVRALAAKERRLLSRAG